MKIHTSIIILFLIVSIFSSCEKEIDINSLFDKFNGNQSIVIPIGSFDAEINSVVTNYFNNDPYVKIVDDEVHFVMTDSSNFVFHYLNFLDKLQPQFINDPLTDMPFLIQSNKRHKFTKATEINFGLNSNISFERVDSVKVENAGLIFEFADYSEIKPADIEEIKLTSNYLNKPILIKSSDFRTNRAEIDINDYTFVFLPNGYLPVNIEITVNPKRNIYLNTSNGAIYSVKFNRFDYKVAYGKFEPSVKTRQVLTRRLVWNDFLRNSLLRFSNPQIDVQIRTNAGANLRFEFDSVLATYPDNSKIYSEFNGIKYMSENIGLKPSIPGSEITYNLKTFDNSYGKTYLLFDKLDKPDSLIYGYGASLNTDAYFTDKTPDFLLPDSRVFVKIKTTLPFQLNEFSNYNFTDSVTGISGFFQRELKNIEYGKMDSVFLVLRINNLLPVSADIKLRFVDNENLKIDSDIVSQYKIASGRVDASGKVIEATINNYSVMLTKNQFELLRDNLDKLHIEIKFQGMNESSKIYITAKDKISVHAGIFLKNLSAK